MQANAASAHRAPLTEMIRHAPNEAQAMKPKTEMVRISTKIILIRSNFNFWFRLLHSSYYLVASLAWICLLPEIRIWWLMTKQLSILCLAKLSLQVCLLNLQKAPIRVGLNPFLEPAIWVEWFATRMRNFGRFVYYSSWKVSFKQLDLWRKSLIDSKLTLKTYQTRCASVHKQCFIKHATNSLESPYCPASFGNSLTGYWRA